MQKYKLKFNLNSSAGFTLIEVLIATTILAFISFTTYQLINQNTDSKDKVISEDQDFLTVQSAFNRIESDFNELYSPLFFSSREKIKVNNDPYQETSTQLNSSFEGRVRSGQPIPIIEAENKSSFQFLSLVNRRKRTDMKETPFVWIKYSIRKSDEPELAQDGEKRKAGENELIRQSITQNPFTTTLNWSEAKTIILLKNIKNLEFQYYDTKNKKFISNLSELNENKNALRLLKIKMTWINQDHNEINFEKNFRVIQPLFNTQLDEVEANINQSPWGANSNFNNESSPTGEANEM